MGLAAYNRRREAEAKRKALELSEGQRIVEEKEDAVPKKSEAHSAERKSAAKTSERVVNAKQ